MIALPGLLALSACQAPDPQGPDPALVSSVTPAVIDTGDTAADSGPAETGIDTGDSHGDTGDTGTVLTEAFDLPPGITNLIVVHVDTLRADRLGLYGHERETTPLLSARGGRVIRGMQTVAPWTLPSTSSLLTGLEPQNHRLFAVGSSFTDPLDADITTLIPKQDSGYRSLLLSGNPWVGTENGLGRDFSAKLNTVKLYPINDLQAQVEQALAWIDGGDAPFMVMFQPMNMHSPYFSPDNVAGTFVDPLTLPWRPDDLPLQQSADIQSAWNLDKDGTTELVRAAYDEQILGVDLAVDLLMQGLEARGLLESTLVVLTADHGETLGDADLPTFDHSTMRPEVLEIPLVLFHPQIRAEEFTCTAMNIDTLPTLFTAIGIPLDIALEQLDGRPLQQGCRETTRSSLAGYGELIAAGLSTPDWQVYHSCKDGATLLYDRAADPENLFPLPILEEPTWPILRGQLTAWIAELDIPGAGLTCPMLPR